MSDRVVSILRTAVPTAWGALLGLLLPHTPWLPAAVSEWLQSVAVVEVIVGLCIVGWYAVWRWAEPRIPAWLVTLVLGSSKTPTYAAAGKTIADFDDQSRFWIRLPVDDITTEEGRARQAEADAEIARRLDTGEYVGPFRKPKPGRHEA